MKIALFYPSQELGGAELLMARLANHFSNKNHEILVIDSPKGIIRAHCTGNNITHITATTDNPVKIANYKILSLASHISTIHKWIESGENCTILFWSVHPYNTIHTPLSFTSKFPIGMLRKINRILLGPEEKKRIASLHLAGSNNAIIAMDGENARTIKYYHKIKTTIPLIPIPAPELPELETKEKPGKKDHRLAIYCYGRLCDFKAPGLIYFINKLKPLHQEITITIIGDGNERKRIQTELNKTNIQHTFLGALNNKAAIQNINSNADLVFAMGTAALESGLLSIPTILSPASYKKINNDLKFKWLHETRDFDLGNFNQKSLNKNGISAKEIIKQLKSNKKELIERTNAYTKSNHSLEKISEDILIQLSKSKLKYTEYLKLIPCKPGIIKKIYILLKSS